MCHSGRVVGVIGERDITRAVADGTDLDTTSVTGYMTVGVITIEENASAQEAIQTMDRAGVRHLLVTGREEVVGMLSLRDFGGVSHERTRIVQIPSQHPIRIAFDVPEADALEQARDWGRRRAPRPTGDPARRSGGRHAGPVPSHSPKGGRGRP